MTIAIQMRLFEDKFHRHGGFSVQAKPTPGGRRQRRNLWSAVLAALIAVLAGFPPAHAWPPEPQELAAVQVQLGDAHLRLRNIEKARAAYRAALALLDAPQHAEQAAATLVKLGDALRGAGDLPGALAAYDEAIRRVGNGLSLPTDAAPQTLDGGQNAAQAQGPNDIAEAAFRPPYVRAHAGRLAVYAALGDPSAVAAGGEAVRLARALAERANDAESWQQALALCREWLAAYQTHCPAAASCPPTGEVYRQGTEIALRLGDQQDGEAALRTYQAAAESVAHWRAAAPEEAGAAALEVALKLGGAYLALEDKEKAVAAWRAGLVDAPPEKDNTPPRGGYPVASRPPGRTRRGAGTARPGGAGTRPATRPRGGQRGGAGGGGGIIDT